MPDQTSSIKQLEQSILKSAAGQPFDFSISAEKKKKDMAREAIKLMLLNGIINPFEGEEKPAEKKKKKSDAK